MFGREIPLFSMFGFKVGIDITWFILAMRWLGRLPKACSRFTARHPTAHLLVDGGGGGRWACSSPSSSTSSATPWSPAGSACP